MYKGFNISGIDVLKNLQNINHFKNEGDKLMANYPKVDEKIRSMVLEESIIPGNLVMNKWFNQIDADIFISHSHNDLDLALAFSGYLYEKLGLKCFIDSKIWGMADDLLKEIDDKYSLLPSGNYNYTVRNHTTSHVHNMLLISLTHMIDNTDCLFFLNTTQSVPLSNGKDINKTLSPWIFSELEISSVIREKPNPILKHFSNQIPKKLKEKITDTQVRIAYDLKSEHLLDIPFSYISSLITFNDLNSNDGRSFLNHLFEKHIYIFDQNKKR